MVSYIPERAPSSASSSSTPSSPKAVNFAGVSGVSRPMVDNERWACYDFDAHARECHTCRDPYGRYKAGKRLCRDGNKLAVDVSSLLYRKEGEIYSRIKENGQMPRVEMPSEYERSRWLLKSVEKGLKHRYSFLTAEKKSTSEPTSTRHRNSVSSQDHQARPVLARMPASSYEQRYPVQPTYTLPLRQVHTNPEPAYTVSSNPFAYQVHDPQSHRGSLYETELARIIEREQLESQMAYTMDVPERIPRISARGHVRHRHRPQSMFLST